MKKIKKILIVLIILVTFLIIGVLVYKFFFKTDKNEVKVIKTIDKYGYTLDENETKLYKEEFEKLDKILSSEDINYEDYAKEVSKLFIIDFYTLSNKLSKNDIGGTQFIKEDMRDNFIDQARSTFYKYVEVKSDKRTQKLPEVSLIDDVKVEDTKFAIKDKTTTKTTKVNRYKKSSNETIVDAYKVTISWDYKEDLGYETEAKMILIKDNNKLYIVEMD